MSGSLIRPFQPTVDRGWSHNNQQSALLVLSLHDVCRLITGLQYRLFASCCLWYLVLEEVGRSERVVPM